MKQVKKKCSWTEQLIIKWLFFFLCEVEKSISLYDRQLPGSEKEPGGKTQPMLVSTRLKLRLNYYWRHREPWENMLQKSLDPIPITRADQGTTTQNSLFPPSSYTHTSFPIQEVENRALARPITQGHAEDQPHLRPVRGEVFLWNGPGGTLNKHECSRREWLFLPPVHQPPQRCQSAES